MPGHAPAGSSSPLSMHDADAVASLVMLLARAAACVPARRQARRFYFELQPLEILQLQPLEILLLPRCRHRPGNPTPSGPDMGSSNVKDGGTQTPHTPSAGISYYVCIFEYTHTHIYKYIYIYMNIKVYVYAYIYMHIYGYVYVIIYIYCPVKVDPPTFCLVDNFFGCK